MSGQPYTPDEFNVRMVWGTTGIGPDDDLNAEFDRFIAKVKAEAWDEGYGAGELCGLTAEQPDHACPINPYRNGAGQ